MVQSHPKVNHIHIKKLTFTKNFAEMPWIKYSNICFGKVEGEGSKSKTVPKEKIMSP